MFCEHCGNILMDEKSKFCEKCGKMVMRDKFIDGVKQEDKTILSNAHQPQNGFNSIWPEWQIEKQLGKGSYGVVYQAVRRDNNVESYAAIKIISIPSDSSEVDSLRSEGLDMNGTRTYFKGIVDDFVSEIQLMESLKGIQNIVSVEDYKVVEKTDAIGWEIYIRMELLTPFNTYICDKTITEEEVIKLGIDICTALEICGQRNIIHRDIKPENIFVNDFGYFKLGDFGIARKLENMTGGLSQKGTFNYMAPEVANSNEYDAKVDTYSLGIVLYRLLNNNKLPFLDTDKQLLNPNERKQAVERRIRGEALPVPCNASPAMANLILRACAHNPNARFASATEMKQALETVKNGMYKIVPINEHNKTEISDLDKTEKVRRAVVTTEPLNTFDVNTFGKKEKEKKSKLPIIIVCLVLVAALVAAAIFVLPKLLNDNTDDGKESETVLITDADKDNLSKKEQNEVKEIVKVAESDASAGNYEEALKKIEDGIKEYPDSETLKNKSEEYEKKIQDIKISEILSDAKAKAEVGNYEDAFKKVEAGLKIYPDSTELKNKADGYKAAYDIQVKDDILLQAAEYASSNDYLSAMNIIKNAQKKYGNKDEFTEALGTYEKEYFKQVKTDALTESAELAKEKKYLEAIERIDAALVIVENDIELTSKKDFYETNYINNVISEADNFVGEKKYTEAIVLLESSLKEYPQNTKLFNKLEDVKKQRPVVNIATMIPINAGLSGKMDNAEWNSGVPKDPFGNIYSDAKNFIIVSGYGSDWYGVSSGTAYMEYRIYKQFSTIEGFVCPYYDMHENGEMTIQIVGDDRVLYETSVKRKMDPLNFKVDVTGVDYLKIIASYQGDKTRTSIIMGDVVLY